ncbi:homeobox protein prospero-like [Daphnia carinata]|uniref:homeobox protein prospero-like n=1 Tax=Daphnia carinata TaxID=120202 RepID=UPI0025799455|nr:homeobox protein prospero-like [Daphnia carinata]
MALLEHPSSQGGYSLSFLAKAANNNPSSAMVGDLLDQQRSSSELSHVVGHDGIQVTGKLALSHSSSSSTSGGSSAQAAVATSVIRRSPDSPDSSNEDSAWFLRQVLQQQQQQQQQHHQTGEHQGSATPLTPATSPARGIRRPRHDSIASDVEASAADRVELDDEDEEIDELKKESINHSEDEEEEEKSKRARVESIVSAMRTSTPAAINGCKKRKLYQPQQHGHKFTSEGEEEDDETDERNDSLSEEQHELSMARAQASSRSSSAQQQQQRDVMQMQQPQPHDPIRSLQERIASLHQQRFAALQQQQQRSEKMNNEPVQQQQPQIRRPVRDDAGRTRNALQHHQPMTFGMRSNLPSSDLSHVSQAHAAYLDATRRMLMEQQRQQAPSKSQHAQQPQQLPVSNVQQPAQPLNAKEPVSSNSELEGLAEMLKSELASSLAQLVDSTLSRFAAAQQQQRRHVIVNNQKSSANSTSADESELSKLQRGRVIDRGLRNGDLAALGLTSPFLRTPYGPLPHHLFPQQQSPNAALNHIVNSIGAGIHPAAAAAAAAAGLANIGQFAQQQQQQQQQEEQDAIDADAAEQNEALSLVVSPKKRRFTTATSTNNNNKTASSERNSSPTPGNHQNVETRLSPLEISLINHSSSAHSPPPSRSPTPPSQQQQRYPVPAAQQTSAAAGGPPPLLHHPSLFSNYSAYFAAAAAAAAAGAQQAQAAQAAAGSSSQRSCKSPELDLTSASTSASLLHPALLASHHHHHHQRSHHHSSHHDNTDRHSESSDGASPYGSVHQSSTLTPMHLRKAKLMFFWCRYPSSSVLKTFFPDVNFNKNNTAQLVKWFSNFREFYYIQMEKYSRQLLSEGVVNADDIHVSPDSELFRALNLHYNRNNHIEVPSPFVFVVSETLREFFKAIQAGKDAEPSWKKAIYKIIARLDEQVPEYFRTPNFLEHLE